jgi:hypothetical protein
MLLNSESYIKKCPKGCKYYAAKLLFQYRVQIVKTGICNKKRPCSVETVIICAKSPKIALRKAKRVGKDGEVSYLNTDGNKVHVEFVGITEMIDIDFVVRTDQKVWVWFGDLLTPMERKEKLTLTDQEILNRIS